MSDTPIPGGDPGQDPTLPVEAVGGDGPPTQVLPTPPAGGDHGGRRRGWVLPAAVAVAIGLAVGAVAAALAGGDDADTASSSSTSTTATAEASTTTTSASSDSTTTSSAEATTTTSRPSTSTTSTSTSTTTTTAPGPRVESITASDFTCPSQLTLTWRTSNATSVEIGIDNPGGVYDTGPANGSLEVPAPCAGDTQTYYVTAIDSDGRRSTKNLTVP